MRSLFYTTLCAAFLMASLSGAARNALAAPPEDKKPELKADVAALLNQSTNVYKKMKSYRHTAKSSIVAKGPDGEVHDDLTFTLALERPNKFVYKLDNKSEFFPPVAAYSDGTTFINFKSKLFPTPLKEYTKAKAPASFKGINIVDDVEFQPIGTYIIALMLQGDSLADKDVRGAMEKATLMPPVTENGKKWQVLEMPFGSDPTPYLIYIGQDDHLIGKAIQKGENKITETIEAIKIDKPIEASVFQYTLPSDAKEVEKFTAPQRPNDARRSSGHVHVARR
jgi:outer membrane lipoprotein-sorting protein